MDGRAVGGSLRLNTWQLVHDQNTGSSGCAVDVRAVDVWVMAIMVTLEWSRY